MRRGIITSLVQVFFMAVTWQIMELGVIPFGGDFGGKLIICVLIFFVAKIVGAMLGD